MRRRSPHRGPPSRVRFAAVLFALPLALALAPGGTAFAQSDEEIKLAKQAAGEGFTSYKKGDYDRALALFDQAVQLYPSGNILRMHGYTLLALEKWGDALDQMEKALETKTAPLTDDEKKDVRTQMEKARAHFTFVKVKSSVEGATLVVDGRGSISLPIDKPLRLLPGRHTFLVKAKGMDDVKVEKELEAGKESELSLDPKKVEIVVEKPKVWIEKKKGWFGGQDVAGYALLGVGGALAVASGVVGGIAGAQRGTIENDIAIHKANYGENCNFGPKNLCNFDRQVINASADVEEQTRWSAIGLGIGAGAFLATGTLFWLFSEKGPAAAKYKVEAADAAKVPACLPVFGAPGSGTMGLACGGRF